MQTRRLWSPEEDQVIEALVEEIGTKRWSEVSQLMKTQYGLVGRSGKQCRERWHNHLAPDLNKRPWSKQEQAQLFEAHRKLGNKWTEISKIVEGRTDNAIKNHFYSSVRRSLRRMGKILGTKNSTNEIRTLKPLVLSSMFQFYDKNSKSAPEELRNLPSALFAFSQRKMKKGEEIDEAQRINLQNLIEKLKQFNDDYEKSRGPAKEKASTPDDSSQSDQQEDMEQMMDGNIPSLQRHLDLVEEKCPSIRMNLEESAYDWAQFESKCDLVRNYLLSQNSLLIKSEPAIMTEGWTPAKTEKETPGQKEKNHP